MYASSQWFAAQALSSIRHGMGSRVAFTVARRAKVWIAARRAVAAVPGPCLTIAVSTERSLAIDGPRGCTIRLVSGQLWITAEGHARDVIANPGVTVTLEPDVRSNVSAFRDAIAVVALPPGSRVGAFALSDHEGERVLTVTTPVPRWHDVVQARIAALIAGARAYARRRHAARLAASQE